MPTHPISAYWLRTIDVGAAGAFYEAVLGHHGHRVVALPEQARARGARPHWLGVLHTDTPDAHADDLLADGGSRLGPLPDGSVVVRDPGGAMIALGPVPSPPSSSVVWHVLRTRDAAAAMARYARLFGWAPGDTLALGEDFRSFSWSFGEAPVGVVGGIERSPEVHAQWLYAFGVPSIEAAIAIARAHGARMLPPAQLPRGDWIAVGDDPQGAAFGLMQAAS